MKYYEYILCVYGRHVFLNENSKCNCLAPNEWWQEDYYLPFFMDDIKIIEQLVKKSYRKHYYSLFSWGFDNQIFLNKDGERREIGNVIFFDIDMHEDEKLVKFLDYFLDMYGDKYDLGEPMVYRTNKGFHVIFFKLLPYEEWANLLISDKIINKYVDNSFIKATFVRNGNVLRMSPIKYKKLSPHRLITEGEISDIELKSFRELILKIIKEYHKTFLV